MWPCGSFVPKKPMTNADRIRAMSDEELKLWLSQWCRAAEDCIICPIINCPNEQNKDWLDWLQQPYGGADHE